MGDSPASSRRNAASGLVGERLRGGVVAGDERDAGAAVATRAAEIQAVDRDRLVDIAFRAWAVRSHLVRMDEAVAVVTGRRTEHGAHVLGREGGVPDDQVLEVRGQPGDLVDDALPHLDLHLAVAGLTF